MTNYATTADLQALIPDIATSGVTGVTDWTAQLTAASADVLELWKVSWWKPSVDDFYEQGYAYITPFPEPNLSLLNTAVLKNLTCYRALARYICPYLTNDSDQADEWNRKAERYQKFYEDEWEFVKQMPLYDWSEDGNFKDWERVPQRGRRCVRA